MTDSDKGISFAKKLLAVQQTIEKVVKNSTNPYFKSNYADLNTCLAVGKAACNPLGIYIDQPTGRDQYGDWVETRLTDSDNGLFNSAKKYLRDVKDIQDEGKQTTYLRRYTLKSLLAMEEEDDDGETSVGRGAARAAIPQAPARPEAKPIQKVLPSSPQNQADPVQETKERLIRLIGVKSKVAVDKKLTTFNVLMGKLKDQEVDCKEDLSLEGAKKVLEFLTSLGI